MAVAKRQGGERPAEIEQRKVRGPQVEQTALLASPIYIRQAQGEEKHIKGGAKALSLCLPCMRALFLSLSLSLPLALGCSSLCVFGSTCPHPSRMDFPAII